MSKPITKHEGSKYLRKIQGVTSPHSAEVDVYAVLVAFNVTCPARQHAIKKLLCAGIRGKGNELADLTGAEAAVCRAIDLQQEREKLMVTVNSNPPVPEFEPVTLTAKKLPLFVKVGDDCPACRGKGFFGVHKDHIDTRSCHSCRGTGKYVSYVKED